jgi:methionine-rich copper-binding protein CopC
MSKTLLSSLAAMALIGLSSPAFAHAHLKAATPAAGSSIATTPQELDLDFSEDLNLKFSGVTVKGPNGAAVETGDASLARENTRLVVPLTKPLGEGAYTVDWHALSADGHKTKGSYSFTVQP